MTEEDEKLKEAEKRSEMADRLLELAVDEKDESHYASLMFQFSKQMKLFCENMAEAGPVDLSQSEEFLRLAGRFDDYAILYRLLDKAKKKRGNERDQGGSSPPTSTRR